MSGECQVRLRYDCGSVGMAGHTVGTSVGTCLRAGFGMERPAAVSPLILRVRAGFLRYPAASLTAKIGVSGVRFPLWPLNLARRTIPHCS
jgi:hypothetical protein